jgi:circadian clock protein KaiC
MERVKTGIDGLDQALGGGIPRGNIVLVSGSAGTGKTLLSLSFIYYGATNFKERL